MFCASLSSEITYSLRISMSSFDFSRAMGVEQRPAEQPPEVSVAAADAAGSPGEAPEPHSAAVASQPDGPGDASTETPPPPPPPLLIVDSPPQAPVALEVTPDSMSLQWTHSSVTVQSPDERAVNCAVLYELAMQQARRKGRRREGGRQELQLQWHQRRSVMDE